MHAYVTSAEELKNLVVSKSCLKDNLPRWLIFDYLDRGTQCFQPAYLVDRICMSFLYPKSPLADRANGALIYG
jgi:hypothetical protein